MGLPESMGDSDELYSMKNNYYIGNYQACINEAQRLKSKSTETRLKDFFLYRALLAQRKYGVVKSEIRDDSHAILQALKYLAIYYTVPSERSSVIQKIEDQINQDSDLQVSPFLLVQGTIYYNEKNYELALQVLNQADCLECRSMMIMIYLKMDRIDAAKKELKVMQEKDEDHTLCQLAQAWVHVASGGEKLMDAYYIFQELIDKTTATPLLLNGQAACFLGQGKYEEAESALQESFDKDPNNPDTLLNLMVLSHLTSKPMEVANRYLAQLKDQHKELEFVQNITAKEEEFERVTKIFAV